ncbi:polysaccharide deacetylase family protein [Marinobacter salinexigens]|uniref:Polysaccharide deacetylase family protein n=1 Tax=Marinobacter salinexigens TaxID=2919747 RepID=A0A5B0VJP0_9GAMM|nr:polysaccharide deacetylase family protein [Marinobacter salinexigens]KAA1174930.1 polysaccharide deacetylase family protein [Marinobacter salinexigens]
MIYRRFLNALRPALFLLVATQASADLVVLQYHHVSDSTPSSTSTSRSLFEAQLRMISDMALEVAPLETATREALAGEATDEQLVAITFDDAYESVYANAASLLESFGFPYTVFVNTEAVGRHGYMTWEQLSEIGAKQGVTLANHSADHGHLARKPGEAAAGWESRVQSSLDDAQAALKQRLGTNVPMVAYPYGEFDGALLEKISDRRWYGYGQQSGAIGKDSDPRRLPRFPMANAYGQLDSLKDKLRSKAFPVDTRQFPDGIIQRNPPKLTFTLPESMPPSRLTCFASGMGAIDFEVTDKGMIEVMAPKSFSSRRFRYNCTYPANSGRFYWMSQQWLDLAQPED